MTFFLHRHQDPKYLLALAEAHAKRTAIALEEAMVAFEKAQAEHDKAVDRVARHRAAVEGPEPAESTEPKAGAEPAAVPPKRTKPL